MITGLAGITVGVADLKEAQRYLTDFGLALKVATDSHLLYELDEGSTVTVKHQGDDSIPAALGDAAGSVREISWAVASQEALDALEVDLAHDLKVKKHDDGTLSFVDPSGIATRLRLFQRHPVVYCPDPLNAPDTTGRLGKHRRWRRRCHPKTIQHLVYVVDDALNAARFYMQKLHFQLSDISDGLGYFLRAPGIIEHHSIFFMQKGAMPGIPASRPEHVSFGVEDIDEMMVGANYMDRQGWKKALGPGRHRIGSALFCYFKTPFGVEFEYGTDNDHLDEHWQPLLWEQRFGFLTWLSGELPPFLRQAPDWTVSYVPKDHAVYQPWLGATTVAKV